MIKEIDLFGIFLPPMLVYATGAAVLWYVLRRGLSVVGFYRFVWHPALFDAALYVLVLAGIVVAVLR